MWRHVKNTSMNIFEVLTTTYHQEQSGCLSVRCPSKLHQDHSLTFHSPYSQLGEKKKENYSILIIYDIFNRKHLKVNPQKVDRGHEKPQGNRVPIKKTYPPSLQKKTNENSFRGLELMIEIILQSSPTIIYHIFWADEHYRGAYQNCWSMGNTDSLKVRNEYTYRNTKMIANKLNSLFIPPPPRLGHFIQRSLLQN